MSEGRSGPRWAAMTAPKGSMIAPSNDMHHNLTDDNKGGSPRGGQGTKNVPIAQRGGFQHPGQKVVHRAPMGGGKSGSGNPATRGGTPHNFHPETRVPGHGGSPQTGQTGLRNNIGGGFGNSGQKSVPSHTHADPKPATGNTSGLAYRRIAGRFKRAAMGARPTSSNSGRYGSPPVTANT